MSKRTITKRASVSREFHEASECCGDIKARLTEEANRALAINAALRDALHEASHVCEHDNSECWCALDCMVPYRGHDAGCESIRAAIAKAGA